jgi:hypothetical protein
MREFLITDMLQTLKRLQRAAANRENHAGDPSNLFVVKAELREAAEAARVLIEKVEVEADAAPRIEPVTGIGGVTL